MELPRYLKGDLLKEEHIQQAAVCLTDAFVEYEPMACVLEMQKPDYNFWISFFVRRAVDEQLSLVALDSADNVIGVLISEDFYFAAHPEEMKRLLPSDYWNFMKTTTSQLGEIFMLLEELDQLFIKRFGKVERSHIFHNYMIGVDKKLAKRGIAQELVKKSHELAKKMGFKMMLVEATGAISQSLYEKKLNYKKVLSIAYDDFIGTKGKPLVNILERYNANQRKSVDSADAEAMRNLDKLLSTWKSYWNIQNPPACWILTYDLCH
jgi:ribosomal protein S18 acetylase RimI-like enzyme